MGKLEEQGSDCLQQRLKARPRLWEEAGWLRPAWSSLTCGLASPPPAGPERQPSGPGAAAADHAHAGLSEVTECPLRRAASQGGFEDRPR